MIFLYIEPLYFPRWLYPIFLKIKTETNIFSIHLIFQHGRKGVFTLGVFFDKGAFMVKKKKKLAAFGSK